MKRNLSGIWKVAFDNEQNKVEYKDTINLPATTEQAGLGEYKEEKTSLYLGRKWPICGKVWYKRTFDVPQDWEDKYIQLTLERTKYTKVWIDEILIGESFETLVPQIFELGKLSVGQHELIIVVDNDLAKYDCFPKSLYDGHQYSEHTQTNWNGILGEIYLSAHAGIFVENATAIRKESHLEICLKTKSSKAFNLTDVFTKVVIYSCENKNIIDQFEQQLDGTQLTWILPSSSMQLWDEYAQNMYEIVVTLTDNKGRELCEKYSTITGVRQLEAKNYELHINSNRISLRGSLDCAIYPLTGACPFEEVEWITILEKMKAYGMNHYRFHSWCPPEAAFLAADKLGVYLQVELSCFANEFYKKDDEKYDKVLEDYLYGQSKRVIEIYGNHPSFILFAVGNEMKGNLDAYNDLLKVLKEIRSDILYCQGANNFLEDPIPCEEDQFWVTMRTKRGENVRASFSHNDLPLGSIQSKDVMGTLEDYDRAAKISNIPLISHEIGQFQSFPLVEDKNKYVGPLRPDTYTILEDKLKEKGLLEKNRKYYEASGALLVQCYKAEIEANLRTNRMSGFQLLGLQDFPGQGTALVGVLDSMLEGKGFIEEQDWKMFCNQVVVMATFPKYCYTSGEEITIEIYIYNYSGEDINGKLAITLLENDQIKDSIVLNEIESTKQCVKMVCECKFSTNRIHVPGEVKLKLAYEKYENEYSLWIYPKEDVFLNHLVGSNVKKDTLIEFAITDEANNSVWVTNTYNEKVDEVLKKDGKVLLCTSKRANSIGGFFPTDFWCYPMFKEACINSGNPVAPGTMGLLIDKEHPALEKFPTKEYSQWQWQQIVSHSTGVILDDEKDYQMIVQVIDNFDRNHVLGLVYEKKVEQGKLLECSSDLLEHLDIPEMRQLFVSLLNYTLSEK